MRFLLTIPMLLLTTLNLHRVTPFKIRYYLPILRLSPLAPRTPTSCLSTTTFKSTQTDFEYMSDAVKLASTPPGGTTYPNPPVGCVIVDGEGRVKGRGFHPCAGMPHAEVFALFQSAGLVSDGYKAALGVMVNQGGVEVDVATKIIEGEDGALNDAITEGSKVPELLQSYLSLGSSMFVGVASGCTAYVTLEPCSHMGKTPPCCEALAEAGVERVVIGQRDPNPKVDGGGVTFLQSRPTRTVDVVVMDHDGSRDVARDFLVRMEEVKDRRDKGVKMEVLTGKRKRELRGKANRLKSEGNMTEVNTPTKITPSFVAAVDRMLRDNNLLLLRNAGTKKKEAKVVGEKIRDMIEGVEIAQVVGHTVLLYRLGVEGEGEEGENVGGDTIV